MTQNMFTNPKARRPLTRATLGVGLALAAIGTIGLGSGVARAVPQQPLLVGDPLPVPTPAGPNPTSAVNIANAIFAEIGNVLSAVFPGSSSVLMPGDTPTSPVSPGLGNSGLVPAGEAFRAARLSQRRAARLPPYLAQDYQGSDGQTHNSGDASGQGGMYGGSSDVQYGDSSNNQRGNQYGGSLPPSDYPRNPTSPDVPVV